MKDTGIWFHPSGILGASPGGIVDHETGLEVKCPYTERNLTIEEAAKSETFCLEKTESGQYALRKHHVYWHQGCLPFTRNFGKFPLGISVGKSAFHLDTNLIRSQAPLCRPPRISRENSKWRLRC